MPSTRQTVLQSFAYLRKYWLKETAILLLILLRNAGALSFPFFLKIIVDDVFPESNFPLLLQILGAIVGIQLVSAIAGVLSTYLQQQVSNHIMEDIRTDFFEHVIHLPIDFYNKNDIGEVVHSLSNEVNILRRFLSASLIELSNNIILIIGISAILIYLNAFLFLVCITLVPILLIGISFFHNRIRHYYAKDRQADAHVLSFMMEKLDNVLLIKLYNQYSFEMKEFNHRLKSYIDINLKGALLNAQGTHFSVFVIALAPILVIAVGSRDIFDGFMTLGTLIAFIEYFNIIIAPSRGMVGLYYNGLRSFESMSKITSFLNMPTPARAKENVAPPERINQLVCEDVRLSWGSEEVLKKVNLYMERGKSYGLVGGSGSGKSTITYLLCGLYEPQSGRVLVNAKDAREWGPYAINEKVALVKSTTKLQKGTIRENMLYGLRKEQTVNLQQILETVGLADYIDSLPEGLDTDISDLGTKLSDGQRQRLSIARALLKDADVLILDEATSAMDSIRETEVIDNILELYHDKIVVIISHRLSSIQRLDQIICLRNGEIVEQNDHQQLLESRGVYWELFEQQLIHT